MDIEFEVQCNTCGAILTASDRIVGRSHVLEVDPCTDCQNSEYEIGLENGKNSVESQ